MTTKHRTLTTANCPALARTKALFNGKVYREVARRLNEESRESARDYLRRIFRPETWHKVDEILAD